MQRAFSFKRTLSSQLLAAQPVTAFLADGGGGFVVDRKTVMTCATARIPAWKRRSLRKIRATTSIKGFVPGKVNAA